MMFYVIDQNVMRRPSLAEIIRTQPTASFIVPDTALLEMVKSEKWEDTMRGSFAKLTSAADRTFISLSIYEAIRIERQNLTSIDRASLLPEEFTKLARDLIPALANATGGPTLERIRVSLTSRLEMLEKEANAATEKLRLEPMVDTVARALGPKMTKDLRARRIERDAYLGLIQLQGDRIFEQQLSIAPDVVKAFRLSKPLLLRQVYLMLRNALLWVRQGGVHTANPNKVLNDRLDLEYVLVASFFERLLTDDKGAADADEDLRLLLDDAKREQLQFAFADYNASLGES